MSVKIAKSAPFEGAPHINTPEIYGIYTGKEMMYRIPVTGLRPVEISVLGLPEGLIFENGIIKGRVERDCEFTLTVTAENTLGTHTSKMKVKSAVDCQLLTPLMGFTTWNALGIWVNQAYVEHVAELLDKLGIAEYGYNHVNLDSAWQGEYGGEHGAIMPNYKFHDMKAMCDKVHSYGFKCGIYSTPMKEAWGCPDEFKSIPGCTTGETDTRYGAGGSFPIGVEHHEAACVKQWEEWGFDYLKYDWCPTDPVNADLMKQELLKSKRAFEYCVTVDADIKYADYWSANCNSWRANPDSIYLWKRIRELFDSADKWAPHVKQGHFYDLDMLECGKMCWRDGDRYLTDHEALFAYTMRALFMSPLQISCDLEDLTDFEFDMLCNEEILAIHQDALCSYPKLIEETENYKAYEREMANGDKVIAIFNVGLDLIDYSRSLDGEMKVRDVWTKTDIGVTAELNCGVKSHCVRVFRITKA